MKTTGRPLRPGSHGHRCVRAANQAREGIGPTRAHVKPLRCESERAVQRALILLASLDYQSGKDSRLTKTRRFGTVRSEPVFHYNRRLPSARPLSAGSEGRGSVNHAQFGIQRDLWARFCSRPGALDTLGASNRGAVFNRVCRPSCVPTRSSAATPALHS